MKIIKKDLLYWLEFALRAAEKEKARLHQAGDNILGLDFDLAKIDRAKIKKYLSISTEERMKRSDTLMNQEIAVDFAIRDIHSIIYYEKRNRGEG